jgi:hypothetical protein
MEQAALGIGLRGYRTKYIPLFQATLVRLGKNLKDSLQLFGFLVVLDPKTPAVLPRRGPSGEPTAQLIMSIHLTAEVGCASSPACAVAFALIDETGRRFCARFANLFAAEGIGHL